jgi:hypothetical protein
MISVRLSEEEYSALRRLCLVTGARSVSDLTRDAMRGLLSGPSREDGLNDYMAEFRREIRHLNKKIEYVAATVEAISSQNSRAKVSSGSATPA